MGIKSWFRGLFAKKAEAEPMAPAVAAPASVPETIANRPQFVAAIASAIATHMGTEPGGLRIHSIRRVDGKSPGRGEFVAAVSAAIAMQMGTEPNGLRIHSIRPVEGRSAGRGEFVAAIAGAIAQAMGTEPSGLRIHSMRRVL